MDVPERAPAVEDLKDKINSVNSDTFKYASEYNGKYLHWSELRYRNFGDSDRGTVWLYMKMARSILCERFSIHDESFSFIINNELQGLLHKIDEKMIAGLFSDVYGAEKEYSVIASGSVIEESITSSQMEGASTTTKLAEKLLRNNIPPADRSQRMIVNNYRAMQFIKMNTDAELTSELILKVHSIISEQTLDNDSEEGCFRKDDSIAVRNKFEDITYYLPVSHEKIVPMIDALCRFINDDRRYIHPIVKGILLHFMIAYIHPFADGNGRVSRCMFYWYAMKKGYSLVEFLSLSKCIKSHRQRYGMSYLLTETDDNDVTYFIRYNLEMICESIDALEKNIRSEIKGRDEIISVLTEYDLTMRQASILRDMIKERVPISVYDLESKYCCSASSLRRDLLTLADAGLITTAGNDSHRQMYAFNKDIRDRFS